MDFKSFTESIQDMIKEFLPGDYKDASVELVEQTKLNEQYTGLVVRKEGQVVVLWSSVFVTLMAKKICF